MPLTCPACATIVEPEDRFCPECGGGLVAAPEVVLEVETGRSHIQNHACQLRFRVTSAAPDACDISLKMVLHARGRHIEQEEEEIEQYGTFQDRGEQFLFSFPFRPLIPGEIPVETLRMVVGPVDNLQECRVFELPDRCLFVRAADPNRPSPGPGIIIDGGIHLDLSKQENYGSDVRNLLNLNVDQSASPEGAETTWQAIRLRPAGTEKRIRCTFAGCGRPVALPETFSCAGCQKTVCRRHRDAEDPACCNACAEQTRSDEFRRKSQQVTTPTSAA